MTSVDCSSMEFKNGVFEPEQPQDNESSEEGTVIPSKLARKERDKRKKVSFADDHGLELHTIRTMNEPSNVPPVLNSPIVRALIDKENAQTLDENIFGINFKQPGSEFMKFQGTLASKSVALENIMVQKSRLVGTIKAVKKDSPDKKAFVRITDNNWKSFVDHPAVPGPSGLIYDSFVFNYEIPAREDTIRLFLCVCYTVGPIEFWDNNGGRNFEIVIEPLNKTPVLAPMDDAYLLPINTSWGEFASWKNFSAKPYY